MCCILVQDLGHALQFKGRTLADLQQLVLAGKLGNTMGIEVRNHVMAFSLTTFVQL